VKKPLEYYRGFLSADEIADGINAARRNAMRLMEDAQLLLSHKRYPTAAALAILAIEEAGKVAILRTLPFAKTESEAEEIWRDYRNHRAKNGAWVVLDWARSKNHVALDFSRVSDKEGKHTEVLEAIKQIALYTDCYRNRVWSEPLTSVDEALAEGLVHAAEILARAKAVSLREIQLWIEHLGPAWNTPDLPNAIVRWAQAMEAEGLSSLPASEFQKFMFNQDHFAALVRNRMKV
jgi:AbiV family abortive infection protein